MKPSLSWIPFFVASFALGLSSCSADKVGMGGFCEKDSECKEGLVCRENICTTPDNNECNPPCPNGQECKNGKCVPVQNGDDNDGDGHKAMPQGDDCNDDNPYINPDAYEYCDGVDNNCDGRTDEDCPPCENDTFQDCGTDVGECTPGIQRCVGGSWQPCDGQGPTAEKCDGLDNDCDGQTDESCPCQDGETQPCGSDVPPCTIGQQSCNQGKWSACSGLLPMEETCDGEDNDCDGLIDEGFNVGVACTGIGECGEGVVECAADFDTRCSTMPGGSQDASQPETCDGLDNDCDGETDEGIETDDAPNDCPAAEDLGPLPDDGSSIIVTGNLWPAGDEDWYKVQAIDNLEEDQEDGCDNFHFSVRFLENPGDKLLIDVKVGSCTPTEACVDDTEFDYAYDGQFDVPPGAQGMGQCPCSITPEEGKAVCSKDDKIFFIRVHGPSSGSSCDNYQLLISNGAAP